MTADSTKKLNTLLRKLGALHAGLAAPSVMPEPPDEFDAFVHQLIFSLLLWEASTGQARNAMKRLRDSVVDYNELRVCVADEVAHVLGEKYPLGLERSMRLRTILNDVYQRQHNISLKHLADLSKREARHHLEALAGCPCFVAARVCLLQGLGHAIPVDERLRDLLVQEQVLEEGTTAEAAASWLEHHIKAEEALSAALLLQAWSDEHGHPPRRDKRPIVVTPERPPAAAAEAKSPKAGAKAKVKSESAAKKSKAKPRSGS